MAGGAESAEKAWQWALPMSSVPLYVQQEEQHDKAHNDQAYCLKHANNEIYLSHCACHYLNIAKGTTDPGVDCFDQLFCFGRLGSVCLVG